MTDMLTLESVEMSAKSAHKRIDTLEKKVEDLHAVTNAVARVDQKVDNIKEDMDEIKADVKLLNGRPGVLWDKVLAAAIGAAASGLVVALLAGILK